MKWIIIYEEHYIAESCRGDSMRLSSITLCQKVMITTLYSLKEMKYIPIIIIAMLMLGCGQGKDPRHHVRWGSKTEVDSSYTILKQDTAEMSRVGKEESNLTTKSSASSKSVRSSSRKSEYDNMRGFDPASEDDMDDNGMSRYMENNDEEGWD